MEILGINLGNYEKRLDETIAQINQRYEELKQYSDEDLTLHFTDLKNTIQQKVADLESMIEENSEEENQALKNETQLILDEHLVEVYAYVKTAVEKTQTDKDSNPIILHDSQLRGGIEIHRGKAAKLRTGEGKTLTAALPAVLNALTGKGVHVVTVNPHLAERDMKTLSDTYSLLGMTVGLTRDMQGYREEYKTFNYDLWLAEKRTAYSCDITYGENSEFHFDFLRDKTKAKSRTERVQRSLNFAIIDEADYVLEDEARTPHILSEPASEENNIVTHLSWINDGMQGFTELYQRISKKVIEPLIEKQKIMVEELLTDADSYDNNDRDLHRILKIIETIDPYNEGLAAKLAKSPELIALKDSVPLSELELDLQEYLFTANIKENSVLLTEIGEDFVEQSIEDYMTEEFREDNKKAIEEAKFNLLKAHTLMRGKGKDYAVEEEVFSIDYNDNIRNLEKDKDYTVSDGRITIKDEDGSDIMLEGRHKIAKGKDKLYIDVGKIVCCDNQGRRMPGRKWSHGLHQAVETKEEVMITPRDRTSASITTQDFYRLYSKIAGMTATPEEAEFLKVYGMETADIRTDRPFIRRLDDTRVYKQRHKKLEYVVDRIIELHKQGRPVLVSAGSDTESDIIGKMLKARLLGEYFTDIQHIDDLLDRNLINKLNQKTVHDDGRSESDVISNAGKRYAITISTRMVGRGTDIKVDNEAIDTIAYENISEDDQKTKDLMEKYSLNFKQLKAEADRQLAIFKDHYGNTKGFQAQFGGLHVIGTYLPELERYEEQLSGRAGRQGDIGSFELVTSVEDIVGEYNLGNFFSEASGMFIGKEDYSTSLISQIKKVMQWKNSRHNSKTRKNASEFGEVTRDQSKNRYRIREQVIDGDISDIILESVRDTCSSIVERITDDIPENWDWRDISHNFNSAIGLYVLYDDSESTDPIIKIGDHYTITINGLSGDEIKDAMLDFVEEITKKSIGSMHLDKNSILGIIDEHHIALEEELDNTRQSINMQSYAGKDPLTEFKIQAAEMYSNMIAQIKKDIAHDAARNLNLNSIKTDYTVQRERERLHPDAEAEYAPMYSPLRTALTGTAYSMAAAIGTGLLSPLTGISVDEQNALSLLSFIGTDSYMNKTPGIRSGICNAIMSTAALALTAITASYISDDVDIQNLSLPIIYTGIRAAINYLKQPKNQNL